MEKMKRIKKRLSLTLRPSQTVDESLSELAEQMTVEDGGTKDSGKHSNFPSNPSDSKAPPPVGLMVGSFTTSVTSGR